MLLLAGILIVVLLFAAALNGSRAANEIRALRRQQWLQAERERLKAEGKPEWQAGWGPLAIWLKKTFKLY